VRWRAAAPGARLYGMGGRRMAAEGVELLVDVTAAATIGGTEWSAACPDSTARTGGCAPS